MLFFLCQLKAWKRRCDAIQLLNKQTKTVIAIWAYPNYQVLLFFFKQGHVICLTKLKVLGYPPSRLIPWIGGLLKCIYGPVHDQKRENRLCN